MISDKPINRKDEDKFQRYPFAERLSRIISGYQPNDSLTIGLYGKWGEGKSTIINFVESSLSDVENIATVKFNPWLFSTEQQLLQSFFEVLAQTLKKSLRSKSEKLVGLLNEYALLLNEFGVIPGASQSLGILNFLKSKVSKDSIEDLKQKVDNLLQESDTKVVIFMDDIDRLQKSEIQDVFRLVKITADFKNTIYLLAFDHDLVAKSLNKKYAKGGHEFLEKIIQVPLNIPLARPSQLKNFTFKFLEEQLTENEIILNDDQAFRLTQFFDKYLLPHIDTPRISVRFSNSLKFILPLLKSEVNIVDLILLECIKSISPALYNKIRIYGELFLPNFDRTNSLDKNKTEALKTKTKRTVESFDDTSPFHIDEIKSILMELFPQLKSIFELYYGSEYERKEWNEDMRICSPRHFDRYFSFSVAATDISEVAYKNLLNELSSNDYSKNQLQLRQLVSDLNIQELVLKFQFLEDQISQEQSELLCQNLAQLGDLFPNGNGFFGFYGEYTQVAAFIGRLTAKHNRADRITLASKVLDKARPLDFGWEIWRRLERQKETKTADGITQEESDELGAILLTRTKNEYSFEEMFESVDEGNLMRTLIFWSHHDMDELKVLTKEYINHSPDNLIKLLDIFSSTTMSSSHPKPYKSGFDQNYYDHLKRVTDIKEMYKLSIHYFGLQEPPEHMNEREPITQNELIGWFQLVHRENMKNKS